MSEPRCTKLEKAAIEYAVFIEVSKHILQYNCFHTHGKKATKACDDLEHWAITESIKRHKILEAQP